MELTIDQALQQGVAAHKAGKLQDAEKLYRAILQSQPQHPDANHNLGVLAVGFGKVQEALPYLKHALETNPKQSQFWLSYIDALIKLGQLDNARQILQQGKASGLTGDQIDRLEVQLSNTARSAPPFIGNATVPSKQQVDGLILLYTQGKLQDALAQGITLSNQFPDNPTILNVLGAVYAGLSRYEEAIINYNKVIEITPDFAEAYNNLGITLNKLGQYEEAVNRYNKAIEIKPEFAEAYYNLGNALKDLARLDEAEASYRQAIALKPDYAEAYSNLGIALKELGKHEESINSYNKAIEIKPDFAEACNNLGNILNSLSKHEEAINSYNKAIELKPDYAEAYNNLGTTLNDIGKHEEAIDSYNKAIELKPDYTEPYFNLGMPLKELGQHEEAINSYNKAIEIKPDFAEAYTNLGATLCSLKANGFSEVLARNYLDVLSFGNIVRPISMVNSIIVLLKHHDTMKEVINCKEQDTLKELASECCIRLSEIPLFMKILEVCPVPDLKIEEVLTELRRILLLDRSKLSTNKGLLRFQIPLALQCFTNEYIYEETEDETVAIKTLEASLQKSFSNSEEPLPYDIACLASYRSLFDCPWARDITPSSALEPLFKRQVMEVNEELVLKEDIPRLNSIENDVSLAVQNQYEENPYPRWVSTRLEIKPRSINQVVAQVELQVTNAIDLLPEAPQILIAGCGTGQHALETASRFKDSHVTAVDLSLSSLAYAKRKTKEFGVTNINYLQADILDLGLLDKQFDIIESVGVLHHMADPLSGWKVLTDCLKPNGLMRIGLYSELARQGVVKARDMVTEKGISSDKEGMLEFRRQITKLNDPELDSLEKSSDFYSTSTIRDLLFHVQEHRFTIPGISEALDTLGLAFMGFELSDKRITRAFKAAYSQAEAIYDLGQWHEYETLNPELFGGMYQFWVQKI